MEFDITQREYRDAIFIMITVCFQVDGVWYHTAGVPGCYIHYDNCMFSGWWSLISHSGSTEMSPVITAPWTIYIQALTRKVGIWKKKKRIENHFKLIFIMLLGLTWLSKYTSIKGKAYILVQNSDHQGKMSPACESRLPRFLDEAGYKLGINTRMTYAYITSS